MTTWPIGLSTGCFHHENILDRLEMIRGSGFRMIEVCSAPRHLDYHDGNAVRTVAKRIEELGMEAYSFHAPFADRIDISAADVGVREQALVEIAQAVDAAAMLGVRHFVIHPGPEHLHLAEVEERRRRMENAVGMLNRIARRCQDAGIVCVLENKLPHLLFGNAADILAILEALDSAEVGVCLDTGHASLSGDLSNAVRKFAGRIRLVHAHDNGGTFDDHLPPGEGNIDWDGLVRELAITGFAGAIVLELAGAFDAEATMARARRGRTFLRKIARQVAPV
jgi:sugar phosphate isomerase/epimerase